MAASFAPLANITLGSNTSSVTFSSISSSYRDLYIVVSGSSATGNAGPWLRLNSDTGSNYNHVYMSGNGSSTASGSYAYSYAALNANVVFTTTSVTNMLINIMDYSATDKHKTMLVRTNNASNGVDASSIRWANTAAITSVVISTDGNPYATGTIFTLYGVSA